MFGFENLAGNVMYSLLLFHVKFIKVPDELAPPKIQPCALRVIVLICWINFTSCGFLKACSG